MIYNKFGELSVSALGMGCMRFPTNGDPANIDMDAAGELIAAAIKNGINYFDTAWGYHGGKSESAMGELLSAYPRDSYYLASKFPGFNLDNMARVEEIFNEQLKRCRVDYFDFYLFHNVCENNIDAYLDKKYGILEYLLKQKENGRIRHLGFSAHGSIETVERFIDACAPHMEFCQIQLNYLDYTLQDAKGKLEMLNRRGIPVIVMEPLRGGKLATLDEEHESRLKALRPGATVPSFAFRFLKGLPGIFVTLSGMSGLSQLEDNINTYSDNDSLTEAEQQTLLEVAADMMRAKTLPCTDCKYCISECPMGLDIPKTIALYNDFNYSGGGFVAPMVIGKLPEDKRPSACVGCRACEAVCPQGIKISEMMSDFSEKLQKKDD